MTEITARLSTALAGRYQIERRLGEGGMATVYLANDLKHDRKVALKVLKAELAAVLGAERFVQEIKTTASLQHPHILPLFDSGEADGFLYYVMPFIDGETLREKLNRETQLGIDEAVGITTALADALDYAHRNNVIHRDIKPENILLHDGRPMVADFGIALAVSAAAGGRMTETGLSLGTPHYMSPEQATAEKDLTNRSDIYSLGSVLYEMLTGSPPHVGSSAQQIIMKIVTDEARPVTELRKSVPPNVAVAVARSLEKLAADRFASAAKFAEALTSTSFGSVAVPASPITAPSHGVWNRLTTVMVVLTTVLALVAIWALLRMDAGRGNDVVRVAFEPDPPVNNWTGPAAAISPDGKHIAYLGGRAPWEVIRTSRDRQQLFLRSLDDLESHPIEGTEGAYTPFFSPDGAHIGFVADGQLKRVALAGGAPVVVSEASLAEVRGATWGDNDVILFSPAADADLMQVPGRGGTDPSPVHVELPNDSVTLRWPSMLPGSKAALVTLWRSHLRDAQIGVIALESGVVTSLIQGTGAHYTSTGHIVFTRGDGSLLAAPFDLDRLNVTGAPVSIESGLNVYQGGAAQYAVSMEGTLIYRPPLHIARSLVTVDRSGSAVPLVDELTSYGWLEPPRYSPDGTRVSVSVWDGLLTNIWILDVEQRHLLPMTTDGGSSSARWMPDGGQLVFASNRGSASWGIYHQPWDASLPAEPLVVDTLERDDFALSPDGASLLFAETRTETGLDLSVVDLTIDAGREPTPFLHTPHNERAPEVSPDGRWVSYVSDESGRFEVYVRPLEGGSARVPVSTGGGFWPAWSANGRELFYHNGDSLMAARVDPTGPFRILGRELLFQAEFVRYGFDVHPDGSSFVMTRDEESVRQEVVVVFNWFDELRRRMGR